jgi:hypothetical protein
VHESQVKIDSFLEGETRSVTPFLGVNHRNKGVCNTNNNCSFRISLLFKERHSFETPYFLSKKE